MSGLPQAKFVEHLNTLNVSRLLSAIAVGRYEAIAKFAHIPFLVVICANDTELKMRCLEKK